MFLMACYKTLRENAHLFAETSTNLNYGYHLSANIFIYEKDCYHIIFTKDTWVNSENKNNKFVKHYHLKVKHMCSFSYFKKSCKNVHYNKLAKPFQA